MKANRWAWAWAGSKRWPYLVVVLAVLVCSPGPTQATDSTPVPGTNGAVLVVDYGDGRMTYAWVPFTESSISGVELLHRSGLDVVTVSFGGLGEGVCRIETIGCDVDPCRARLCQTGERESPFWRYLLPTRDGQWSTTGLGASASRVEQGDVNGWAWSGTEPTTGAPSFASVVAMLGVQSPAEGARTAPLVMAVGGEPEQVRDQSRTSVIGAGFVLVLLVVVGAVLVHRAQRRGVQSH